MHGMASGNQLIVPFGFPNGNIGSFHGRRQTAHMVEYPPKMPLLVPIFAAFLLIAPGLLSAQENDVRQPACRIIPLPDHRTAFMHRGQQVATWHFGPEYPRPFFYPLKSARGTPLTRMGHPGAPDHDHHRSVWFAHHKIAGIDFWGDHGTGRIRQKQWLAYEDGENEAVMAVLLGWFNDKEQLLMEQEVVAAWRPGAGLGHELELQLTFRPAADQLELEKTNFGFLAIRMAKELSGHFGTGQLRDSEQRQGEKAIFAKSARWVDYSGPTVAVKDGREGIAYFDHPGNPHYPSHWHVRDDGWMGAGFSLKNAYTLKRESPLVLRYLLLAHSGNASHAQLEVMAKEFAQRPGFSVSRSKRPHRQFEARRLGKLE